MISTIFLLTTTLLFAAAAAADDGGLCSCPCACPTTQAPTTQPVDDTPCFIYGRYHAPGEIILRFTEDNLCYKQECAWGTMLAKSINLTTECKVKSCKERQVLKNMPGECCKSCQSVDVCDRECPENSKCLNYVCRCNPGFFYSRRPDKCINIREIFNRLPGRW